MRSKNVNSGLLKCNGNSVSLDGRIHGRTAIIISKIYFRLTADYVANFKCANLNKYYANIM